MDKVLVINYWGDLRVLIDKNPGKVAIGGDERERYMNLGKWKRKRDAGMPAIGL